MGQGQASAAMPSARRVPSLRRAAAGKRVAVFGGGMGGLTVAHELAERGFQVTVYERKAWGGKCRSMSVPNTGSGGRKDLPAEHGFRFFPGFYQNLPDTMSRIPLSGGGTAFNNLVAGKEVAAFYNGTKMTLPAAGTIEGTLSPDSLLAFLTTALNLAGKVSVVEIGYFLQKMIAFVTSGPERRYKQWENMSFSQFVHAEKMSKAYNEVLVEMFTGTLVAAKPDKANAHTMGLMAEAWVYSTLGLGGYKAPDRLLNAPTNDALIDPWMTHLRSLGVTFQPNATLTKLNVTDKKISGAQVTGDNGAATTVEADHYVLAVPVERAVPLLNDDIIAADPSLKSLRELTTDWMNGIMLYLRQPIDLAKGHVAYAGQPWALTSISQAQFWKNKFGTTYGKGDVNECLSIDLSAWDRPGVLYGKAARDCTSDQIIKEILAQLRKSIPWGDVLLSDANIHSYFIDPAITGNGTPGVANDEPLLINRPSSWNYRPEATTALPNLFLASDYVRADINLATMEGANEAGRKAANAILDASGAGGTPAKLFKLYLPNEFKGFYDDDDRRYKAGQANAFDLWDPAKP
ncbi:FAD-dependent oxidoreductase [Actinomadura barringtoniae]|uniref:FAD-dependent oxidoreductase n=2 Tax=Actinomadura barringtoniae TaxID=1427535 RepID=A0A939T5L1_9ACTN|nr:FAD-dependent oxidoreductase [Actinomadura barringtoniae]